MRPRVLSALIFILAFSMLPAPLRGLRAQKPGVERNVVYGMVSGLALLMDVHRPDKPNGAAIVAVIGTGFHSGTTYDAAQMKEDPVQLSIFVGPLVSAGYTVFVINHRTSPGFLYPAAVDDAERAVRFVRHSAARFGVAPERIGAVGASSGGYLVSMLGVRSGMGNPDDTDAINRVNARVQAVVAFCPVEDLTATLPTFAATAAGAFLGSVRGISKSDPAWQLYQSASPIHHVTADDAPLLLIHGDKDPFVPFEQSERMEAALRMAKVETSLIRVPGSGHVIQAKPEYPDFTREMTGWFDRHLRPIRQ